MLTAPELFVRIAVLPQLETFLENHPMVSLRTLLVNRLVNLVGEGVDLAVRLAPLGDATLRAPRIGAVRTMLCASPTYMDKAIALATPTDLEHHACICLDGAADGERWAFASPSTCSRKRRSVRVPPRLSVNNAAAVINAAMRGHGLIQVRSYQVADAIADGCLTRLLPEWEESPAPVHLVFPADRSTQRSVRALIDYLGPALRRRLTDVETSIGGGPTEVSLSISV